MKYFKIKRPILRGINIRRLLKNKHKKIKIIIKFFYSCMVG
jgi:hypothetical protein